MARFETELLVTEENLMEREEFRYAIRLPANGRFWLVPSVQRTP